MNPPASPSHAAHCFIAALAGWMAGTGAQVLQPALWPVWGYALEGALAALAAWFVLRRWRFPMLWLLCAALLAFSCTGWRATQRAQLAPQLDGQALALTGVVAALPQRTATGWRFLFAIEEARLDGAPLRVGADVPPRVLLRWRAPDCLLPGAQKDCTPAQAAWPAQLRAGERWRFEARVQRPHGQLNPHGFDWELWLWARGIAATGSVHQGAQAAAPALLGKAAGWPLQRLRQSVRERIGAALARADADEGRAAGIVAALALGDQSAVGRSGWEAFRRTGTAHLMVVSGLHITLLAWLAFFVLEKLWRLSARLRLPLCDWMSAPTAARLGALAAAAAYAALSGWSVPAQRTLLMLAAALLPGFAGQRLPRALTLLLAGAAVLAFDPWALAQPGFWLSFAAVALLLASSETGERATGARGAALGYARRLLGAQARLTLALAPLTLLLFGQASLASLAANIVAIPWVTLLAVPLALAGVLWPALWQAAAALLAPLLAVLDWFAAWPQAAFTLPAAPWPLALLACGGALLAALRLPPAVRLAGLALALPLFLWQPPRPAAGHFTLTAIDVGQGSAVLLQTARHSLLYDAGPGWTGGDAGAATVLPLLRALGERPDIMLISHSDSDHSGGAASLAAALPHMQVRAPLPLPSLHSQPCRAGDGWTWDGVRLGLLHPAGEDLPAKDDNATSCVLRVQAADGNAALLTGDISAAEERTLLRRLTPDTPDALRAALLLMPHHGSAGGSSAAFLAAVQPRWALAQAGHLNRFGHPAPAALARYAAQGVGTASTAGCGAIVWQSSAPAALHCTRAAAPHYWRAPAYVPGGVAWALPGSAQRAPDVE